MGTGLVREVERYSRPARLLVWAGLYILRLDFRKLGWRLNMRHRSASNTRSSTRVVVPAATPITMLRDALFVERSSSKIIVSRCSPT